tara:strand:+ start:3722 stop:3943 length:222 start_codon:yes stop_codon:yes gene_type:complete
MAFLARYMPDDHELGFAKWLAIQGNTREEVLKRGSIYRFEGYWSEHEAISYQLPDRENVSLIDQKYLHFIREL